MKELPNEQTMLTVKEMAVRLGVAERTMYDRIKAIGIAPTFPSKGTKDGVQPALFDAAAYEKLASAAAAAAAAQKVAVKELNTVSRLTVGEKSKVMQQYVQDLSEDDSKESMAECFANAAGFIALMQRKMQQLSCENEALGYRADVLEKRLGEKLEYATVKYVEKKYGGVYNWRELKAYSIRNNFDMPKVDDVNYGAVNSYHVHVWKAVYGLTIHEFHYLQTL